MKSNISKITLLSFVASSCVVCGQPPVEDLDLEFMRRTQAAAALNPGAHDLPEQVDEVIDPEFVPPAPLAQGPEGQVEAPHAPILLNPVLDTGAEQAFLETASSTESTAPVERDISAARVLPVDPEAPFGAMGLYVRVYPRPQRDTQSQDGPVTDGDVMPVPGEGESDSQGSLSSGSCTQLPIPLEGTDLSRFLDDVEVNQPQATDSEVPEPVHEDKADQIPDEITAPVPGAMAPIPEDEDPEDQREGALDDPESSTLRREPTRKDLNSLNADLDLASEAPNEGASGTETPTQKADDDEAVDPEPSTDQPAADPEPHNTLSTIHEDLTEEGGAPVTQSEIPNSLQSLPTLEALGLRNAPTPYEELDPSMEAGNAQNSGGTVTGVAAQESGESGQLPVPGNSQEGTTDIQASEENDQPLVPDTADQNPGGNGQLPVPGTYAAGSAGTQASEGNGQLPVPTTHDQNPGGNGQPPVQAVLNQNAQGEPGWWRRALRYAAWLFTCGGFKHNQG